MNAIFAFLENRAVAFLAPYLVPIIAQLGHYVPTAGWDATRIATWLVTALVSLLSLYISSKLKETKDTLRLVIQQQRNRR